ncbi:hypothetical protein JOB18_012934 [Solea senegalensis]|uniref:Uncharacterized protein n=1 Tax=Solea senegalensis TaxID=28829 RepID=A0AAV6Q8Z8_SOLSE|nr:hypothetical protein JOB18_012934 [Solea senegalensis]
MRREMLRSASAGFGSDGRVAVLVPFSPLTETDGCFSARRGGGEEEEERRRRRRRRRRRASCHSPTARLTHDRSA